ncbi:hypothetical protein CUR178_05360 [Leishmania enriettii]|uniref:Uncharacterized protein n=1 Tax=Leishmania enriettii TaxID=5663 RepID=A0A836GRK4_LEIEN|nr:hypothetical protein CUR178_05360 [Leishmania enriettii]
MYNSPVNTFRVGCTLGTFSEASSPFLASKCTGFCAAAATVGVKRVKRMRLLTTGKLVTQSLWHPHARASPGARGPIHLESIGIDTESSVIE